MSEQDDQTMAEPDDERATAHEEQAAAEPHDIDDQAPGSETDADDAGETDAEDATATNDQAPGSETDADDASGDPREESEEETRRRQEEFAREHDPADHDVDAGEEFRQPGDWTADEDGPQELETDRSLLAATGSSTTAEGGAVEGGADDGSSEEEIRDGGHGWGSAAPRADGAAPEGHPVKAWHDTMTFVLPDEEGYDAEAHECFVDGETAERAGFRHAHG
ncbi:hypothetical protein [uncultured Serinicoccus sp.]|uniref:sunset domain-containing protein n=1 Tax=uncultured Serinicoccus sp. TaxID=735514 RepID=UPI00260588B0|nr:hypothetical protein [uncultured Serinicoccus sp.]